MTEDQKRVAKDFLHLFKLGDKPADEIATEGEIEIFGAIIFKINPRVASLAPTGYGKSEFISMGVIVRARMFQEDFVVASVKYGTSDVIMAKVISHIFDDKIWFSQLIIEKGEELERLKVRRNRTHLTFKDGGSIKVVSLHGSDVDVSKAIGEHTPNVVLDESPLLKAGAYLQVLKILEGTGDYNTTFLFELILNLRANTIK